MRQCLEKASVDAVDSMKDEIQGTRTSADMWQIEKKITVQVSRERAKAYCVLTQHHDSVSKDLTGKGGSSSGLSEMAEAEENFRKSISTLVSTVITEGTKISRECGAVLISGILCLVPTLPLDPVLTPTIDLPPGKECGITLGNTSWNVSVGQNIMSSLPSSPLTRGGSAPTVAGRSTIKFGQAVVQPVMFTQSALDYPFFKRPASTPISTPKKGLGTPDARSSPLLKESRTSPEDTPDPTKSPTEPSVVVEDVAGDNDDDEAPALDRLALSIMKVSRETSRQRESPPAKKVQTEDSGPADQSHAKCPMHREMNEAGVMGLRRGLNTNKCVTSCLLQFQSWNWSYSKSVLSINLHSHICPLCELRTNRLQAPRPPTAKPPTGSNRARRTSITFGKRTRPW